MAADQQRRHRRRLIAWMAAGMAMALAIVAAAATWILLGRGMYVIVTPTDAPVDNYSLSADPKVLYANLITGPGEELVSAYAAETETTVTLHVEVLPARGPTLAVGLMAAEPIELDAPLGDRTVVNTLGQQLREVPRQPEVGTIAQVLAAWQEQLDAPTGTLVGDVLVSGGPMGEDGAGVLTRQVGVVLELDIRDEADGSIRTFDTDSQGHYVIPLRPGRYSLLCSPERDVVIEASTAVEADCERAIP